MKTFIYKTVIISAFIVVVFKFTISSLITSYEKKVYENFNKEKIEYVKNKLRNEIKSGLNKEKILKNEDALLIKRFFDKIKLEINQAN